MTVTVRLLCIAAASMLWLGRAHAAAPGDRPVLRPGVETTVRLEGKDGRAFTLKLGAGDRVGFRLVRHEGPIALVLEDPAARERRRWIRDPADGSDTICPRPRRPAAAWIADAAGSWTLRVLPPEGVPPFEVTLVRDPPRKATDMDRLAFAADLEEARVEALLEEGKGAEAAEAAKALVEARSREESGEPLSLASDLGYLGVHFYQSASCRSGAWDVAAGLVRQALEFRAAALPAGDLCVAESLSLVASVLYAQGRFEEGETLEKRSLAIREVALPGARESWRNSLRDVGLLLLQQGKFAEAEAYLVRAREAAATTGGDAPHALADARHNLGELYRNQNRYDAAAEELTSAEALERAQTDPDLGLLSDILAALAGVHLDRADYDEAERYAKLYLDLLAQHAEIASADHLAIGRVNLGEIYRRQGRLGEAEPLLVEALAAARETFCPENPRLLYFRLDVALLYSEQGKHEAAEALYRESLLTLEEALGPRHPDVAANLQELAGMLAGRGRFSEAVPLYERALAIREETLGADHPLTAASRTRLARARLDGGAGDFEGLLASAVRARRALETSVSYPEEAVDAFSFEADLLDRLGRKREARQALAEALARVERLRPRRGGGEMARVDFLRRHLDDYDRIVDWSLDAGDLDAAFAYAERSRARALLDLLTAGTGDLRGSMAPAVRSVLETRETEATSELAEAQGRAAYERARTDLDAAQRRARLADLERQIDAAARRLQVVADDFKNNSPLWRDEVGAHGGPISLPEARRDVVPPHGVMLAYRVGRLASLVFVIPPAPAKVIVSRLVVSAGDATTLGIPAGPLTASALQSALTGDPAAPEIPLLARIAEPPGGPTEDAAATIRELHALRRVLVPDVVRARMRRAQEVVVIPDGALALLPFEVLVFDPAPDWSGARLWLDSGPTVRYAASATSLGSVIARAASRVQGRPTVLTVSDPIFDPAELDGASPPAVPVDSSSGGRRLQRLPGTARESAAVEAAFREAGFVDVVTRLDGARATEAAVRMALPGKRFVHLATHGIVKPSRSDLLAGLALTVPRGIPASAAEDGMLQLFEIEEQKLAAELVVLSACDTNVGRRIAGEGVFSLARGFFAAGAGSVVASLWPVDDSSSARLVGDLFRGIAGAAAGRDAHPAEALRDAKRRLRAKPATAAPFFWAAFTCTGIR